MSYQEAVHYKVPLVGMPFNVDQYVNVNRMVELRIGKRLNFYSMDEEEAISVIKEVMENTTQALLVTNERYDTDSSFLATKKESPEFPI